MSEPGEKLLSVDHLSVVFSTPGAEVKAVRDISFEIAAGETLALVGESGCGKTATAMALTGLLPRPPGRVTGGEVMWRGRDLVRLDSRQLRRIRGREISMVFQDPMTSLHPSLRVLDQLVEAARAHDRAVTRAEARQRAVELLGRVGVANPAGRAGDYPHQWSGGMRQRAMIAMAMINRPRLLIADEPTTALDVTVQAQVLDLLREIQAETGTAILLISHDLGVVAELADRVAVMYAGRLVETAGAGDLFAAPAHPYTAGLLASVARVDARSGVGTAIVGAPPSLSEEVPGCAFRPRCRLGHGRDRCATERPDLSASVRDRSEALSPSHRAACWFRDEVDGG